MVIGLPVASFIIATLAGGLHKAGYASMSDASEFMWYGVALCGLVGLGSIAGSLGKMKKD